MICYVLMVMAGVMGADAISIKTFSTEMQCHKAAISTDMLSTVACIKIRIKKET